MSYLISISLTIVGILSILGLRSYLRMRVAAANEYADASRDFFNAAKPLISDDETPDEIIQVIKMLNFTIHDKNVASYLIAYPLHPKMSTKTQRFIKVSEEFFCDRRELEESYQKMFMSWFIAVTALSPIKGMAARYALANKDIHSAAARASRRVQKRQNGNDDLQFGNGDGVAHAR